MLQLALMGNTLKLPSSLVFGNACTCNRRNQSRMSQFLFRLTGGIQGNPYPEGHFALLRPASKFASATINLHAWWQLHHFLKVKAVSLDSGCLESVRSEQLMQHGCFPPHVAPETRARGWRAAVVNRWSTLGNTRRTETSCIDALYRHKQLDSY